MTVDDGSAQDLKYGTVTTEHGRFKSGEPVFVLRANDVTAVDTLNAYYDYCEDAGADAVHLQLIEQVTEQFAAWKKANPTKVPDSDG